MCTLCAEGRKLHLTEGLNTGKCLDCHITCDTCENDNNPGSCNSCKSDQHRELIFRQCKCMDGFYDDHENAECQDCDKSCATCTGAGEYSCTTCSEGKIKKEGKCVEGDVDEVECRDNEFKEGGACLSCHYSCMTCNGDS